MVVGHVGHTDQAGQGDSGAAAPLSDSPAAGTNLPARRAIRVGLSTASVYPENTEAAFRYAADLGYESAPSFVTMFRKALGASPGRYMAERHPGRASG